MKEGRKDDQGRIPSFIYFGKGEGSEGQKGRTDVKEGSQQGRNRRKRGRKWGENK